ncbi:hypothetical protein RMCBS344292_11440 [Rhizopus microsporus]|nr:hypothetical protein RMCBS344292_11440 [Rhizopus microsporus]
MDKEVELNKIKQKILEYKDIPTTWRLDLIPFGASNEIKSWTIYNNMIPITPYSQYPFNPQSECLDDNLEKNLRESHERERYLERIIHSQANQLKSPSVENTLHTLKNIYLYNQNESKIQHSNEMERLKNEIDMLSRKRHRLDVITQHLNHLELFTNESQDEIQDRKWLLWKIKMNELKLAMKDIELEALYRKQSTNLTNLSLLADKLLKDDNNKKRKMNDDRQQWSRLWSRKEDEMLMEAVQKVGTSDWQRISNYLHERTPHECFERWQTISSNPRKLPSISALLD